MRLSSPFRLVPSKLTVTRTCHFYLVCFSMTQGTSENTAGGRGTAGRRPGHCSGSGPGGGGTVRWPPRPRTQPGPGDLSIAYQAGGRSGLREEGEGLHVEPLVVAREGHGGADGVEGGPVAVQVVLAAARERGERGGVSHTRPEFESAFARIRSRAAPSGLLLDLSVCF